MTIRTGGCQCGAIRYELTADPLDAYACHCSECRKQSASAFGISIMMARTAVRQISGTTKIWSRPAESGGTIDCHFCPECGTRLWHIGSRDQDRYSVKGGSLDIPPDFDALRQIWVSRKLNGLTLPKSAECFERDPK